MEGKGIIKKSIAKLLTYLRRSNFYPREKVPLYGMLTYAFFNYMAIQTLYAISQKWSVWSFNSKVSAIESFNNNLGALGMVNDFFIFFNQIPKEIRLMDGKYFLNESDRNCQRSEKYMRKVRFIDEMEQKTVSLVDRLELILMCFYTGYMLAPTFGILLHLLNSRSLSEIILPLTFFISQKSAARSPPVFLDLQTLLPVFIVESFYIYIQFICTVIVHTLCILTVSNVSLEMDLFCMNLKELVTIDQQNNADNVEECLSKQEEELKSTMRDIAIHHQLIFRKVKKLQKFFLFRLIYGNSFLTIQLAILIFCMQRHPDFFQRMRYAIMMIPLLFMHIAYSEYGQKIEDQGRKMRLALHNFPWQAKPKFIQSSLRILMIRSNVDPQISVFNIFKQNRENMSKLMKLAYSYFNLLERFST